MRKAGASAREMLISAAALNWGVSRSTCTAEAGHIKHAASNRSLSYGELVGKASTLPIPSDVTLKQSKDYKIVGQRLPRLDSLAKVNGEAIYGIDFRLPGMKYALLARCPLIAGKVTSSTTRNRKRSRASPMLEKSEIPPSPSSPTASGPRWKAAASSMSPGTKARTKT